MIHNSNNNNVAVVPHRGPRHGNHKKVQHNNNIVPIPHRGPRHGGGANHNSRARKLQSLADCSGPNVELTYTITLTYQLVLASNSNDITQEDIINEPFNILEPPVSILINVLLGPSPRKITLSGI